MTRPNVELSPDERRRTLQHKREQSGDSSDHDRKRFNKLIASILSDEEKAKFVVDCVEIMTQARVANRKGPKFLKIVADNARRLIQDAAIEPYSYETEASRAKCKYPGSLSVGEIEQKILTTIQERGLTDWYAQVKANE